MGRSNKLLCGNCGYSISYSEGVGMMHPHVCKKILEAMRTGAEGDEFKRYANEIPNPAINMEFALFRCESCGELKEDEILEICERVGEYPKNARYGWRGVENMEDFPMALDGIHKTVYSKPHVCKCGAEMKPVSNHDIITCPRCHSALEKELMVLFD